MRYSKLFPKTLREAPAGAESINHQLLVRAGFIDQLMAGSWTLLPMGWKVVSKIENIIRLELTKIGAQETLMPLLHPREIWDQTGRWSDPGVQEIMYQFKDIHGKEFGLSFTHEEIVTNLLTKFVHSYRDLPVYIYHFSTKFRNELRATSGILRGREFIMKDLYSAHVDEQDMWFYYNQVKMAYVEIFSRMGINIKITEAGGGVFTNSHTIEFQALSTVGEDTIYYCNACDFAQNREVFEGNKGEACVRCGAGQIQETRAIEVGNIFPLGTKYSDKMGAHFTDKDGTQKPIWFASYGIGVTRLIGTLVELFHDDKGIIWPKQVAPYQVHLVGLDLADPNVKKEAENVYQILDSGEIEVLFDDREDISAGEKFIDADLIGLPFRVVVSKKTVDKLEVKRRNEKETKFLSLDELFQEIKL